MAVLVQISDPHFGTERPHVVEGLVALVREQQPALVVLSGDITQRARRAQFAAARAFLDRLNAPHVLVIPGNHDIPLFNPVARWLYAYRNYREAFGPELEPEYESDDLLVLGLNTTRPYRHKDGEVSDAQIRRVSDRLSAARARQLKIVVTHQPVRVIRDSDVSNLLHGHERAVRAWASAGADLVLGGHIHLPYVRQLSDCFPDLPRRLWAVQAGTAVSHRVRDGVTNSVNIIRYAPRHAGQPDHSDLRAAGTVCDVERWDYHVGQERFEREHVQTIALER
ncbi:MAG TPA: metallophosphoesterase [Polyangiaceae bacterium]|nr:metallophosphoesterase [Polyangiaceae bacterium]